MNKDKNIIKVSLQENLSEISQKFKMNIPEEIINYISSVISMYYKGFPFYLIDIQEENPFRKNKIRGDVSLILVGFFKEWINRENRPTTEMDYINTGKLSYFNVYTFLENTYGDMFYRELEKTYLKNLENLYSYLDIFRSLSEEFEFYANFLNIYRNEARKLSQFFDTFAELRAQEFRLFIDKEKS